MYKLPKFIKEHLVKANKCATNLMKHIQVVEDWLDNDGFEDQEYRCCDGRSLEEFEYGTGNVDDFEAMLNDIIQCKIEKTLKEEELKRNKK